MISDIITVSVTIAFRVGTIVVDQGRDNVCNTCTRVCCYAYSLGNLIELAV